MIATKHMKETIPHVMAMLLAKLAQMKSWNDVGLDVD
jgi:hypothetical protein